jgi:hypothetical protein
LETASNHGIRVIANMTTHIAWRNGPIEGAHAGRYLGYGLNEMRVLPKANKSIIHRAHSGFFSGLKVADDLKYDGAWSLPAERVLPFLQDRSGRPAGPRWNRTAMWRFRFASTIRATRRPGSIPWFRRGIIPKQRRAR